MANVPIPQVVSAPLPVAVQQPQLDNKDQLDKYGLPIKKSLINYISQFNNQQLLEDIIHILCNEEYRINPNFEQYECGKDIKPIWGNILGLMKIDLMIRCTSKPKTPFFSQRIFVPFLFHQSDGLIFPDQEFIASMMDKSFESSDFDFKLNKITRISVHPSELNKCSMYVMYFKISNNGKLDPKYIEFFEKFRKHTEFGDMMAKYYLEIQNEDEKMKQKMSNVIASGMNLLISSYKLPIQIDGNKITGFLGDFTKFIKWSMEIGVIKMSAVRLIELFDKGAEIIIKGGKSKTSLDNEDNIKSLLQVCVNDE